ncbi:MAG: hypothetical protein QM743_00420 [Chitinophagaceae bacterium]
MPEQVMPQVNTEPPRTAATQASSDQEQPAPSFRPSPFSGMQSAGAAARRVTRNMLLQTDAGGAQQTQVMQVESVTLELIERILFDYKETLIAQKKTILYTSYNTLKMEMPEPGTLHLISPNSIADSNIQAEKGTIQDLIKKETGLTIRITNAYEETDEGPKETALSKTDIFDEMAAKNPTLQYLKETLRLSIEY